MSVSCQYEVQRYSRAESVGTFVQGQKNVSTIVQVSGETSFRMLCIAAVPFIKKRTKQNLNKCREGHSGN